MQKIETRLSNVPETMLITLWAKAVETNRTDALLRDWKALELMRKIEYDFSKFKKAKFSQAGCVVRARLIDAEIERFLSLHPDAVVIQLGAGLDARYERLGCPEVTHWYDLDLDEATQLRRTLLAESERNTFLSASLFDTEWMEQVRAHNKPTLVVIEGVLMYFAPAEVKAFFQNLCTHLDNATILFDMLAYALVGRAKQHDSLSKVSPSVEFKWSLLESREMETWHEKIKLEKEYYMSDYCENRYPILFRALYKIPYFWRRCNQRIVRLGITALDTTPRA